MTQSPPNLPAVTFRHQKKVRNLSAVPPSPKKDGARGVNCGVIVVEEPSMNARRGRSATAS